MNKPIHISIKIATFLLIANGIINIIISILNLTSPTTSIDSQSLQSFVKDLVSYFGIVFGVVDIFIGSQLIKLKHWAYIFGLFVTIIKLGIHVFTLTELSTTKYISLALSSIILILLIIGKKNFSDSK